jgi:hypothetical protein
MVFLLQPVIDRGKLWSRAVIAKATWFFRLSTIKKKYRKGWFYMSKKHQKKFDKGTKENSLFVVPKFYY